MSVTYLHISQRSQSIEDTVEHFLPAREINLKAWAPEIRTRNLPANPGIESDSSVTRPGRIFANARWIQRTLSKTRR